MDGPAIGHMRLDPGGRNMYFDRNNASLKINFACSVQQFLRCQLEKTDTDLYLKYENGVQLMVTLDNSNKDFDVSVCWQPNKFCVRLK